MERIAIIDGNSLINRAYYAMRNPMMTRDGVYTHAIFGFLNMMDKLRRDYEPSYMAVAFDMKAPTFRHEQYGEYKAGRKKMPPELAMQIPLLKDILDAMGICRVEIEGFEADDIIGTIARASEEKGLEVFVFTGDKDQLQLATDTTRVVFTKKGVSEFDLYDAASFQEKYGFTPLQFIDFKGLAGDSSDNIPGIPGVGEKSATKLIREYGSVENILENAESITPAGLKKKVMENGRLAKMSKMLATINTSVPISTDIEGWKIGEQDTAALVDIYKRLEFSRFLKAMDTSGLEQPKEEEEAPETADLSGITQRLVTSEDELKDISLEGEVCLKIFGDNSHTDLPVMDGACVLTEDTYYYFDLASIPGFAAWFAGQPVSLCGHGLKRDMYMLMCHGADRFVTAYDAEIAQYVLDPGRSGYDLSVLAAEYCHMDLQQEKDFMDGAGQMDLFADRSSKLMEYGLAWCGAVLNLKKAQERKLESEDLIHVYRDIELPLVEVMAAMEKEGFSADREFLISFGEVFSAEVEELRSGICEMAGEEFNINSPAQLGPILFEKLGLPHGKKTKRGYSTSADVLEKIREKHPIVPAILEYRTLTKLKSTYIDGLIPLINERDGKIHAHFMQTVTATGRISCTEPNLQNIPIRQELGRKIRKAFVPDSRDALLVGADYSQIELRVLAHMSGDPALIDAFNRGEDIHRATAANVLGIPEDQITAEERSRAKAVNFGVIYGMSSFGLSSNLNITRRDADEYIKAYFEKHEAVRSYMDEQVAFCKENGYVRTMSGRKRFIPEIKAAQFMVRQAGERLAMNSPIQGSAADIIKIAMVKVFRALRDAGLKSRLILQIHDELIIHTMKDEREAVEKLLVENMESAVSMKVELKADLNEGNNWYELK